MLADAQRSCYDHQHMLNHKASSTAQACGAQVASETVTQPQYQQIKLALDVHGASIVVARMVEGAKPQPPQTFKPADFLAWAKKQMALAQEVISCYLPAPRLRQGRRGRADRFLVAAQADGFGSDQLGGLSHLPGRAATRRGQRPDRRAGTGHPAGSLRGRQRPGAGGPVPP